MRTPAIALGLALLTAPPAAAQQPVAACPDGPVALVLSGGGAKGIAHIGALRILDSAGFRPHLVVGTSMGSIVGALYASGVRGAELDSLPHTLPLAQAFRGYAPEPPQAFQDRPAFLVWAQQGQHLELQPSAADEPRVNAMLSDLLLDANLRAGGDFDRLPIPFRAVATDLRADTAVVLRGGDLARAVRASMSIPVIFPPVTEGRAVLVDGGMVANLPIAIARAEGARRIVAIDVGTRSETDSASFDSPLSLTSRLVDLLALQPLDSLGPHDLYLRPDIDSVSTLDFSVATLEGAMELGARSARAILAGLRCPLPTGPWPAPQPLPRRVGAVEVSGIRPQAAARVQNSLGLEPGAGVDADSLLTRSRRVWEREELEALWLQPVRHGDTVTLSPLVVPPARRRAVLGIAYDSDLGGRIWAGGVERALLGTGVEGALSGDVGGYRAGVDLGLRRRFSRRGFVPTLTASLRREKVPFFAEEDGSALLQVDIVTRWATTFVGVEYTWHPQWLASAGVEASLWDEAESPTVGTGVGVLRLRHVRSPGDVAVLLEAQGSGRYSRALADVSAVMSTGGWRVTPRVRAMVGEDLPLHLTTPLGGWDGFPGLPLGDMRSDREFFGSLTVGRKIVGPLELLLQGAAGNARLLIDFTDSSEDWIYGGRILAGFESPLGPVVVGWGRNSLDLERWFVRIGRWF